MRGNKLGSAIAAVRCANVSTAADRVDDDDCDGDDDAAWLPLSNVVDARAPIQAMRGSRTQPLSAKHTNHFGSFTASVASFSDSPSLYLSGTTPSNEAIDLIFLKKIVHWKEKKKNTPDILNN